MAQITNHAFIVYKVKPIWYSFFGFAKLGLTFAASLPDRKSAEDWLVSEAKTGVNYTIMEVFRNEKSTS
ncbi:MAG: hypothetical protein ABIT05_05610 [Chitinophagaceae bacterium]